MTTQKLKLWHKPKNQIVTKLTNSNCDKTQKLKLWQKSKTQIVTVVIVTVVTLTVVTVVIATCLSKDNLTPQQQMRCSRCSFLPFSLCFFLLVPRVLGLGRLPECFQKVSRKFSKSFQKVSRKLPEFCQKVARKFPESCQRVARQSWDSHETVYYSTSAAAFTDMFVLVCSMNGSVSESVTLQ